MTIEPWSVESCDEELSALTLVYRTWPNVEERKSMRERMDHLLEIRYAITNPYGEVE